MESLKKRTGLKTATILILTGVVGVGLYYAYMQRKKLGDMTGNIMDRVTGNVMDKVKSLAQNAPYPQGSTETQPANAMYPSYAPIKGAGYASPYHFDDNHGLVANQFDMQHPGMPGSETDYTPSYARQDEVDTQDFHKRAGVPAPTHLANVHQPVDDFLGSYRDFEFYQSGCYPHADTQVYAQRETTPYPPGPMASGVDSATMLKPGVYPELTHSDGFQDILIDAPRNLFWADNVFDQETSLTRNFNQSRDLRGDEPVKVLDPMLLSGYGISQSTQGVYEQRYATRTHVY